MANIRLGGPAACARAAGTIAFNNGSATPTPAPRSIARREIAPRGPLVSRLVFHILPFFIIYSGKDRFERSRERCRELRSLRRAFDLEPLAPACDRRNRQARRSRR